MVLNQGHSSARGCGPDRRRPAALACRRPSRPSSAVGGRFLDVGTGVASSPRPVSALRVGVGLRSVDGLDVLARCWSWRVDGWGSSTASPNRVELRLQSVADLHRGRPSTSPGSAIFIPRPGSWSAGWSDDRPAPCVPGGWCHRCPPWRRPRVRTAMEQALMVHARGRRARRRSDRESPQAPRAARPQAGYVDVRRPRLRRTGRHDGRPRLTPDPTPAILRWWPSRAMPRGADRRRRSGKSTVAAMLAELGAVVIDADALAREVVAKGTPGLAAVVEEFGEELLGPDGELDRPAMGRLVFGDEARRGGSRRSCTRWSSSGSWSSRSRRPRTRSSCTTSRCSPRTAAAVTSTP